VTLVLERGAQRSGGTGSCGARTHVLSDEQLAIRVADGDREAFGVLYERHLPVLTRYCRGILRVSEDAEDAAQSAMVAALRSLPGGPPKLKLQAWLFRVAHNEAVSLLRRRRPHQPLEAASDACSPAVTETAALRSRVRELLSDMQALPDRQRTALVLRELCGHEYHEIGELLGCSEAAVMQTVFEARQALTQCEDGRTLSCNEVQEMVSGGDRRSLRARRVRAHLRSCDLCRGVAVTTGRKRVRLALLGPFGMVKLMVAALVGMTRLGDGARRARWAEFATRLQSGSPGLRAAAAGVLLATGGGVTAVKLAHRDRPATRPPHHHLVIRPGRYPWHATVLPGGRRAGRHTIVFRHAAGPRPRPRPVTLRPGRSVTRVGVHRVSLVTAPPRPVAPPPAPSASAHAAARSGAPAPIHVAVGGAKGVSVTAGAGTTQVSAGPVGVQLHAGSDGVEVNAQVGSLHVAVAVPGLKNLLRSRK
jgi:RNA polymerase sigma factor (sigma-70 family)